jgi:hypothetical protein
MRPGTIYIDGAPQRFNVLIVHLKKNIHREDGPAVEYDDGGKCWYQNGKRHRVDGPAIIRTDGYKAWYLNGRRHRVDGPAIEYVSGDNLWFLNGHNYEFDEFIKVARKTTEEAVLLALEWL